MHAITLWVRALLWSIRVGEALENPVHSLFSELKYTVPWFKKKKKRKKKWPQIIKPIEYFSVKYISYRYYIRENYSTTSLLSTH